MSFQRPSTLKRTLWWLTIIAAVLFFVNTFGCIYMQSQLQTNAQVTMRQMLESNQYYSGENFTIPSSLFHVVRFATLTNVEIVPTTNHDICANGRLVKDGKFGFIFPMPLLTADDNVQVCITR